MGVLFYSKWEDKNLNKAYFLKNFLIKADQESPLPSDIKNAHFDPDNRVTPTLLCNV